MCGFTDLQSCVSYGALVPNLHHMHCTGMALQCSRSMTCRVQLRIQERCFQGASLGRSYFSVIWQCIPPRSSAHDCTRRAAIIRHCDQASSLGRSYFSVIWQCIPPRSSAHDCTRRAAIIRHCDQATGVRMSM